MSKKRIERSALLPYTPEQVYDLVNDVSEYPNFMSGCVGAEVLDSGDDWQLAKLEVAKAGFRQSFVTRNQLDRPHSIALRLESGPFKALRGEWRFSPLAQAGCKVSFWLEFEFSNRLLKMAANSIFERVANEQVDSVVKRAHQRYKLRSS